jgi:hypothetical protein
MGLVAGKAWFPACNMDMIQPMLRINGRPYLMGKPETQAGYGRQIKICIPGPFGKASSRI